MGPRMHHVHRVLCVAAILFTLVILLFKRYEAVEDLDDEFYLARSKSRNADAAVVDRKISPGHHANTSDRGLNSPRKTDYDPKNMRSVRLDAVSQGLLKTSPVAERPKRRSKHAGIVPHKRSVVMVLAADGHGENGKAQLLEAIKERQRYADKHHYTFAFTNLCNYSSPMVNTTNLPKAWYKVPVLADTFRNFPDAEWLWWLDQDAMIMNEDIDLDDHLLSEKALTAAQKDRDWSEKFRGGHNPNPPLRPVNIPYSEVNMILSEDMTMLNAGSFFIRRSEWSDMLLDIWSDQAFINETIADDMFHEQGALYALITRHATVRSHVAMVDQRLFNAGFYNWRKGDLAVHFAGCATRHRCNMYWWEFAQVKKTGRNPQIDDQEGAVNYPPYNAHLRRVQEEKAKEALSAMGISKRKEYRTTS